VKDIAAGTEQHEQAARFPNGVPAMSDDDMQEWMEYVYMQQPKPEGAEGVPVKLTAVDSEGNTVDIGTVTSDTSGVFKKMWTPETQGGYTITATFEGSDSYWGSSAEAAIGVGAAEPATVSPTEQPAWYEEPASPTEQPAWYTEPPETVSPTEQPEWYQKPPDNTMLFAGIIIAVIVAIVIGVANLWMHMKQPK
ncbi:MAG: hypothetical protein ACOC6G_04585, partial [Thermoproteota archaeon]